MGCTTVTFETAQWGQQYVTFYFMRHGDCPQCDGRGRISRYRHIDGGRCHRCNGSGGTWPPEGLYEVYRRADGSDIKDGSDARDVYYLGNVIKVKQGWQTLQGMYPTRNEAALVLFRTKHAWAAPKEG